MLLNPRIQGSEHNWKAITKIRYQSINYHIVLSAEDPLCQRKMKWGSILGTKLQIWAERKTFPTSLKHREKRCEADQNHEDREQRRKFNGESSAHFSTSVAKSCPNLRIGATGLLLRYRGVSHEQLWAESHRIGIFFDEAGQRTVMTALHDYVRQRGLEMDVTTKLTRRPRTCIFSTGKF